MLFTWGVGCAEAPARSGWRRGGGVVPAKGGGAAPAPGACRAHQRDLIHIKRNRRLAFEEAKQR